MKQLKDKEMFVQCAITRENSRRVIWANADKAVVGNTVKVEEDNGEWSEGWKVDAVYGTPLPAHIVKHRSHDHTRQRPSSDI